MAAPAYLGILASDATVGNSIPETISFTGATIGTRLVLLYGMGRPPPSTFTDPIGYTLSAGWTIIHTETRAYGSGGSDGFVSLLMASKVCDSAAETVTITHDAPGGGFGSGQIIAFTATAPIVATKHLSEGDRSPTVASPSQNLTGLVPSESTGVFLHVTRGETGSTLSYDDIEGFTQTISVDESLRRLVIRGGYRENVSGTVPLPTVITSAGTGTIPYILAGVALGRTRKGQGTRLGLGKGRRSVTATRHQLGRR